VKLEKARAHLTYCTNIHAGESWAEVRGNLEQHLAPVRTRLAPDMRFGIGLRLSAAAAQALAQPGCWPNSKTFWRAAASTFSP